MEILQVNENFDPRVFDGASIAFGVFDGFHLGHRYIVAQAMGTSATSDGESIALTFDRDPDEVFRPDQLKKLTTNEMRLGALAESGVDHVVVLPFTPEFQVLEPEAFLAQTFAGYAPAHVHVGSDFRFGARAAGDVHTLQEWSKTTGSCIHAHDLVQLDGAPVTATRIRALLGEGNLAEATKLLGHPYVLCGKVETGRGDGADFGFATANLQVKPHDCVIAEGVYAGYAWVSGARYKAAISVGVSPTFATTSTANVEVHLLDFEGNLVGQQLCVSFVERLRDMMKFDSTDALIAQVTSDISWVRENL